MLKKVTDLAKVLGRAKKRDHKHKQKKVTVAETAAAQPLVEQAGRGTTATALSTVSEQLIEPPNVSLW